MLKQHNHLQLILHHKLYSNIQLYFLLTSLFTMTNIKCHSRIKFLLLYNIPNALSVKRMRIHLYALLPNAVL